MEFRIYFRYSDSKDGLATKIRIIIIIIRKFKLAKLELNEVFTCNNN